MISIARIAVLVGVMSLGVAPAGAQQNGGIIDRIDAQGLRALVEGLGHEITDEAVTEEGQPFVTARAGELNYLVAGTLCEDGQCQGLLSELMFTGSTVTLETANEANYSYAAVKVVVLEGEGVVFSRYDVLNGGTTLRGLMASVATLLEITATVVQDDSE